MKNYLNLALGAKTRLQILRNKAKNGRWISPLTWKQVRFSNFKTTSTLDCGLNDNKPIWYSFEAAFTNETKCDTGWYCDLECSDTATGIFVKFPHGRYIAGYTLSMNDERVYFPEIYNDKNDAENAANWHAERIADTEREHAEKWNAARDLENSLETSFQRLRECLILRNIACMDYVRGEISELIETIRDTRETLKTEYAGIL